MKRICKWSLTLVSILSLVNFLFFLDNKSIFMSKVDSLTDGWDSSYGSSWWNWVSSIDSQWPNEPHAPGPSLSLSTYQSNIYIDFSVTATESTAQSFISSITGSHEVGLQAGIKLLDALVSHTSSSTTSNSNTTTSGNSVTLTFHYTPNSDVYDIKCTSPQLVIWCTPVDGWMDGYNQYLENVVNPAKRTHGLL